MKNETEKFIVLIICLVFSACPGVAAKAYDRLIGIPAEELYAKAVSCERESPDSALMCYSLIDSRYRKDMPEADKKLCIDALVRKSKVYFYNYFNIADAYESLSKAEEIAEESGIRAPSVNMQLGILYHTICGPSSDGEAVDMASACYRKGLADALAEGDDNVADVIASNLVCLFFMADKTLDIDDEWRDYISRREMNPNVKFNYNRRMYEALSLLNDGDGDRCVELFDSLIGALPENEDYIRYRIMAYIQKSDALSRMGDFRGASETLLIPLEMAETRSIKDIMADIYAMLASCSRKMNDRQSALIYENKGLKLRDSLINYSQVSRLHEIKTGRNLRRYEAKLELVEARRKSQQTILFVTVLFLVVVVALLVVVFNRNRRLRQSNLALYAKNIDIIEQNEKERALRQEYELKLEERRKADVTCGDKGKYKNSPLDDGGKETLADTLSVVMDNTDEYLHPDFTLERLAELAGSKPKLVSQVINERRGCNFNGFVNEYRIREACVRIRDVSGYGNLTLDAISKSVGFRARSSFFNAFKTTTGLTPSEFQKMARSEAVGNDKES